MADLAEARRFFDGCVWDRARDVLVGVVREDGSDEALEMLATAAWWLDDGETARDARERLFRLRRAAGEDAGAARVAIELAWDATIFRSDAAVARGWVARARRLLDAAEPLGQHAWLALREASLDRAPPATFVAAREIACRAGDFDAEMTALALEGNALVAEGRVEEGLDLLARLAHGLALLTHDRNRQLLRLPGDQLSDALEDRRAPAARGRSLEARAGHRRDQRALQLCRRGVRHSRHHLVAEGVADLHASTDSRHQLACDQHLRVH